MTVGLVVANLAGATALRGYLLNRVDTQLVDTARDTFRQGNVDFGPGGPMLSTAFFTELSDEEGRGAGRLRIPSDSAQSAPKLPDLALPLAKKLQNRPVTVKAVEGGSDWRIFVSELPDGSGALTVGTTLSEVNSTVARLQFIELIVSVSVLALLGIVGSLTIHASLRRLSEVEATANAIAKGDLSHRVPEWGDKTEVGRLALSFNTMLSRIETAFESQQLSETEARTSEERMRRFVADASHELRTPLTSIRGFAELHRQGAAASPELVRHSMQRIESEAERMTFLVEDLLLLARLDQQRPLAQEPVDVVAVVSEIVEAAPIVDSDHVVQMRVADNATSLMVMGDETRLHQVVANLVNNTYTHTPAGTNVTVTLSQDNGDAVIAVSDNGPGMSKEESDRAFERFYRADPSRTRSQGGSGLGLSIVAGIVEAHRGAVSVSSTQGDGSTFVVRIPLMAKAAESDSSP